RGRPVRHPLLVHLLAGHPGREAVHHARPLAQRAHDAVTDREVVPDKVELGLAAGREVHAVRIGDADRPVPDLKLHVCGHTQNLTAPAGPDSTFLVFSCRPARNLARALSTRATTAPTAIATMIR